MIDFGGAITSLIIILVSVILHELAHGITAYFLGDTTAKDDGRLTLNPLKHLDLYTSVILPMILYFMNAPVFGAAKPVPVNSERLKGKEWGMALVALAGPLTNFLIALVSFLIWFYTNGTIDLLFDIMAINLGFMAFNLLPIPPLDGSRILYAIAPDGVRKFMQDLEQYGIFIVMALILVLGGPMGNITSNIINGVYRFFLALVGV